LIRNFHLSKNKKEIVEDFYLILDRKSPAFLCPMPQTAEVADN